MIFSVLFVCLVAAELLLFLGKDRLLGTRGRAALETALRQSYADLKEVRRRLEGARAALTDAVGEAEEKRAQLREADHAFEQSQKVVPTLIHTIGDRNDRLCFRAPLAKRLPPEAERGQKLVWSCTNFVDVWANDIETARQMAARQFQTKHGYSIGEFVAFPRDGAASEPEKAAA